jgi:hypothetical protein
MMCANAQPRQSNANRRGGRSLGLERRWNRQIASTAAAPGTGPWLALGEWDRLAARTPATPPITEDETKKNDGPAPEASGDDDSRARDSGKLEAGEEQDHGEGNADPPLGQAHHPVTAEDHAWDRAEQEPRHNADVDVAGDEMTEASDIEQRRCMEDVGADNLLRAQWKSEQHRETKERPAAHGRQADVLPVRVDSSGRLLL